MSNCDFFGTLRWRVQGASEDQVLTVDVDDFPNGVDTSWLDATAGGTKVTHFCPEQPIDGECPDKPCAGSVKVGLSIAEGEKLVVFLQGSQQTYDPGEHTIAFGMSNAACDRKSTHAMAIMGDTGAVAQLAIWVECLGCD